MKRITVTVLRAVSTRAASSAKVAAHCLLRGYKAIVSPYFAGSCRFLPTCADYADEAIARHGVWRGGWLTIRRLARCHPLCADGHDPVPPPNNVQRHPNRERRAEAA